MENLWSVLVGALLTAVFGLIGLLVNKRNEHQQWLRNQKVEVYTALLRQAHASSNSLDHYKVTGQQSESSIDGITDTTNARLLIIAPYSVRQEATQYLRTLEIAGQAENIDDDGLFREWQASRSRSYSALEAAIRKDLGTNERPPRFWRSLFWSWVYFCTDPFSRWYYRRYGVPWTTNHPTRAMRRHQREVARANQAQWENADDR